MPSNEIKRQFTLGKMEKDKDDRLVEPGAYRDANNVDVSRSEGDDSGALQVVRGNRLPVNQNIDWDQRSLEADADNTFETYPELVKPFGETIGVYPYPQEEKVYFFNTGRAVDPSNPDVEQPLQNAIYEFDQVNNTVSPIIIETDTGDYEAGGAATQEFIGEMLDTQVWGKTTYQDDTDQTDAAFQYVKEVSTDADDFSIIQLTCSSSTVIDRDALGNPTYHVEDNVCNSVCTGEGTDQDTVHYLINRFVGPGAGGRYQLDPESADLPNFGFVSAGDTLEIEGTGTSADGKIFTVVTYDGIDIILDPPDGFSDTIDTTDGDYNFTGVTCGESDLFFESSEGELVCRTGGVPSGAVCNCDNVGVDECDYVELSCPISGGLTRTEEDCTSTAGSLSPNLNYEEKSDLIVEYNATEWPDSEWDISPDPQTDIQYRLITRQDLETSNDRPMTCVPADKRNDFSNVGDDFYSLNGNGAELQPEEFCDPRCDIFDPYPDYCLKTPVLNSLYDTQLTEDAETHNNTRVVRLTNVPGVGDGEQIQVTVKRLRPAFSTLPATFDSDEGRYEFTAPADNGRGVFTPDDVVVVRGLDALDMQQLDAIFGNVGLASRPVGYTYRVARNGALSWNPNSDDVFQAFPDQDTDTDQILSNINPLDANITPEGESGDTLTFDVEVDRQQQYRIDTEDDSDDVHDPNSDQYLDDLTRNTD